MRPPSARAAGRGKPNEAGRRGWPDGVRAAVPRPRPCPAHEPADKLDERAALPCPTPQASTSACCPSRRRPVLPPRAAPRRPCWIACPPCRPGPTRCCRLAPAAALDWQGQQAAAAPVASREATASSRRCGTPPLRPWRWPPQSAAKEGWCPAGKRTSSWPWACSSWPSRTRCCWWRCCSRRGALAAAAAAALQGTPPSHRLREPAGRPWRVAATPPAL
jgi:hypothetical protein